LPGLNELPIFFSIHNIGTIAFSTFGGLVQSDWMVYWIAILIITPETGVVSIQNEILRDTCSRVVKAGRSKNHFIFGTIYLFATFIIL
jgi:hypothetical protein